MRRAEVNGFKVLAIAFGVLSLFSIFCGALEPTVLSIDETVQKKRKDKRTKETLGAYLLNPKTPVLVRERAAWALGRLEIRSQSKNLAKAAGDKSLLVRAAALDALIRMRASSALPLLIKTAKSDPVYGLRIKAIIGLGLLKNAEAIPTLVQLAQENNEEIRGITALAMAAHQSKANNFGDALDFLAKDKSPFVAERAQFGKEIVKKDAAAVFAKLKAEDPFIRLFAAQYVHYFGGVKDLKPIQTLAESEKNEDVKHELELAAKGILNRKAAAEKKAAAQEKAAPAPAATTTAP